MKPSYKNATVQRRGGNFVQLPPVGAYIAQIQDVRVVPADGERYQRDVIEMMIEIIDGEYANRYHEYFENQRERFGDSASYKGIFRLTCPKDDDEDWRFRNFEGNLWCVEQSNGFDAKGEPVYRWDWDEKKLKGKKVGINVRRRLYSYTNKDGELVDGETTEIGQFETIEDVKAGKCKVLRDRDQRKKAEETESTDGSSFTDVSKKVDVPW